MKYYVSKSQNRLNRMDFSPEKINQNICANPYYYITLKRSDVNVIIDSGAFQDIGNDSRLTFKNALKRQLNFENKCLPCKAEAIVSYDRLVDEQLDQINGQVKKRVDYNTSKQYVDETIDAAKFLSSKRNELSKRKLILSCQGISKKQYLKCIDEVLSYTKKQDIIGLGGFCIISKSLMYENQFYKIIIDGFKNIKEAGINKVHIFGVGFMRPLIQAELYSKIIGLELSYDTSSPILNATLGKVFNPTSYKLSQTFIKKQKCNGYNPVEISYLNIKQICNFWEDIKILTIPPDFKPQYIIKTRQKKKY